MLTAMNSVRGRQSVFFVKDLGLALALKMCPDQPQAFEEVNKSQAFTVVGRMIFTHFFLNESVPGAPRHVVQSFAQIF